MVVIMGRQGNRKNTSEASSHQNARPLAQLRPVNIARAIVRSVNQPNSDDFKNNVIQKLLHKLKGHILEAIIQKIASTMTDKLYDRLVDNNVGNFLAAFPQINEFLSKKIKDKMHDKIENLITNLFNQFQQILLESQPVLRPVTSSEIYRPAATVSGHLHQKKIWIVNHLIIKTGTFKDKLAHIHALIENKAHKDTIRRELTITHPLHGRFIDLIRKHCPQDPEIICELLSNFEINICDIHALANTRGLKDKVRSYLVNLPVHDKSLNLLIQCIDGTTPIGAFCHAKKNSLHLFGSTTTVRILSEMVLPNMKINLKVLKNPEVVLCDTLGASEAERYVDLDNEAVFPELSAPLMIQNTPPQHHSFIFKFLCVLAIVYVVSNYLSATSEQEESNYTNYRP